MAFQSVKRLVKSKLRDWFDAQVTKQLQPFLVMSGKEYSDFRVDELGDLSIENMVVNTAVANAALEKQGLPFRVSMVRAKRIYLNIPWEDLTSGAFELEVDGLVVLLRPLERSEWSVESLRVAKEALVERALAALVKKLACLDTGGKKGSTVLEWLKNKLLSHIDLTVHIQDVHLLLERSSHLSEGDPAFALGLLLPSCDIETTYSALSVETTVHVGRGSAMAGVYCSTGSNLLKLPDRSFDGDLAASEGAQDMSNFFEYQDTLRECPRPEPGRRSPPQELSLASVTDGCPLP